MKVEIKGAFKSKEIKFGEINPVSNIAPLQDDSSKVLQEGLNQINTDIIKTLSTKKDLDLSRMRLDFSNDMATKLSEAEINPSLSRDPEFLSGIKENYAKFEDVVNNYGLFNDVEKDIINKEFKSKRIEYDTEINKLKLGEIKRETGALAKDNVYKTIDYIGKTKDVNFLRTVLKDSMEPNRIMNFENGVAGAEDKKLIKDVGVDDKNNLYGFFDFEQLSSLGSEFDDTVVEYRNTIRETALKKIVELENSNTKDFQIQSTEYINNAIYNEKQDAFEIIKSMNEDDLDYVEGQEQKTGIEIFKELNKTTIENNALSDIQIKDMYKSFVGGISKDIYTSYLENKKGELAIIAREDNGFENSLIELSSIIEKNNYFRSKGIIPNSVLDENERVIKTELATEFVQIEQEKFDDITKSKAKSIIGKDLSKEEYDTEINSFYQERLETADTINKSLKNSLIVSGNYQGNEVDDFNFNANLEIYNFMFKTKKVIDNTNNWNPGRTDIEDSTKAKIDGIKLPDEIEKKTEDGEVLLKEGSYVGRSSRVDLYEGNAIYGWNRSTDGKNVYIEQTEKGTVGNINDLNSLNVFEQGVSMGYLSNAYNMRYVPEKKGANIVDIKNGKAVLNDFYYTDDYGTVQKFNKKDKNTIFSTLYKDYAFHISNSLENGDKKHDPVGYYLLSSMSSNSKKLLTEIKKLDAPNPNLMNEAMTTLIKEFESTGMSKVNASNFYTSILQEIGVKGLDNSTISGVQTLANKAGITGAEYNKLMESANTDFYFISNDKQKSVNLVKSTSNLTQEELYGMVDTFIKNTSISKGIQKPFDDRTISTLKFMLATKKSGALQLGTDVLSGIQSAFVLSNEKDSANNDLITSTLGSALNFSGQIGKASVYFTKDTKKNPSSANSFLAKVPVSLVNGKTDEQIKDNVLTNLKSVLFEKSYNFYYDNVQKKDPRALEKLQDELTNFDKVFNDKNFQILTKPDPLNKGGDIYTIKGMGRTIAITSLELGFIGNEKERTNSYRVKADKKIKNIINDKKTGKDNPLIKITEDFFNKKYHFNGEGVKF